MRKRNVLALILCVWSVCSWAQKVTVSGKVIEEDTSEPAFSASVVLLKTTDSTLVTGASSGLDGKFSIPAVKPGKYIFRITSVGFKPYYKNVQLVASKPKVAMGTIKLQTDAALLSAVEVTARQAQVEMKADTFVYNAGAYRVPEGSALEELVKKLPGAEVSEDGTITINGKEVKKIMIDGKEFFDNDTKVAMKNLPTNMVEKIKAYDRQSDYTRMTGIDDGEEETVIDLTVKPEMKKGWLADVDLGYGTEDRYTGRFMVNHFTDKLRLTLLGSANNVNDRGFSGGFHGGWGGNGGLVASKEAGMDFTWENGKRENEAGRLRMGGNVRYNHRSTDQMTITNSETFLTAGASSSSFSNRLSRSTSGNTNVNSNFRLEWSPDTMTRIMFRPNFSFSDSYSNGLSSSVTFNADPYAWGMTDPLSEYWDYVADSIVVNDNVRQSHSDGRSYSVDGMLMANRRLNSKGRNLTLRLRGGYSSSDNNSFSVSDVNYFLQRTPEGGYENNYMHQYNVNPSTSYNGSADLSYSEPLFAGAHLQFSYRYQYRYSDSDRSMYSLDSLVSKGVITEEELRDYPLEYIPGVDWLELARNYQNSQYATYEEHNQDATVMFRYRKDKIRFNAGVSVQPQKTYMDYTKGRLDTSVVRKVLNWAPRIDFRYKFSETGQVRFRYNGRSSQPSMTNLLDVTDDSDPLNVSRGNPGLKPSWTNRMEVFYNNYLPDLQRGWMVHANMSMTKNSISTAVLYDEASGRRTTMPMNINGNWNAWTGLMFNTAMGEKKYFNMFTFTSFRYANDVGYISSDSHASGDVTSEQIVNLSQKSTTKSSNISERLNFNFRNDLLEVGVNGNISYQHARNDLQENANLDTYSFSYGGNVQLNMPWNMSLATNIGQSSRRGYDDESMNTDELIWNAQLSQSFLKGNAATVSVQWYDILQERSNISRSISATQRTDTWTNAINSYVLVHFIYKLNLMGGRNAMGGGGSDGQGRGRRGGPGGFGGPRF